MAKKQIKELVIKVTSPGGKEASVELKQLAQSLESALDASNGLTVSLKTGSKFLAQMAVSYSSVTKSINESVTALKALNTALNGGTAKASKSLNAYVDNLQILTMYLMDAADVAKQFQLAMSAGVGSNAFIDKMDRMIEILEALETTTFDTADAMKRMDVAMEQISVNTGKTAARIKQTRDSVTDLDVTTNRGNETLEEYAARLNRVSTSQDNVSKSSNKLNNNIKNLNGAGSQSARAFSSLAFGMNPLVSTYAAIAVNVYALSEAFRVLKDAAALTRLQEQTAQFSASLSGVNVKALARDLQELAGGALDAAEALKQAVRGVSFGFSPELLRELTEGARKASVALGRDFTDSMDRVIRGISKGEVELLDELGVVTRLETAFKNYATTTGLEADKLTDSQRKLALAQEVNLQLAEKYSGFGTAATGMERLGVAVSDTTTILLQASAKGLDPYAESLANVLKIFKPVSPAIMSAKESLDIYNNAVKTGQVPQATIALAQYADAMKRYTDETTEGTEANKSFVKAQKEREETLTSVNRAITASLIVASAYALSLVNIAKVKSALIVIQGAFAVATTLTAAALGRASMAALPLTLSVGTLVLGFTLFIGVIVGAAAAILALSRSITNGTSPAEEFGFIVDEASTKVGSLMDSLSDVTGISDFTSSLSGAKSEVAALTPEIDRLVKAIESSSGADRKGAESTLQFLTDSKESIASISEITKGLKTQKTELERLADSFAVYNKIPTELAKYDKGLKALEATFSNLQTVDILNKSLTFDNGEGLRKASAALSSYAATMKAFSESASTQEQVKSLENSIKADSELLDINVRLMNVRGMLAAQAQVSLVASEKLTEAQQKELKNEEQVLLAKQKSILLSKNLEESIYQSNLGYEKRASLMSLEGASQVSLLKLERERLVAEKERLSAVGASTVNVERQIQSLEIQEESAKTLESRTRLEQQMEHSYAIQSLRLEEKNALESDFIALQIKEISAKQNMEGLTQLEVEKYGMQVELLEEKLRITKQQEAVQRNIYNLETALMVQERRTDAALNNVQRVKGLESELAIKRKIYEQEKLNMTAGERARAASELAFESKSLNGQNKAAPFADAADTLGYMSGLEGLTELQSTFSSSLGDLSSVYSDFLAQSETGTASFLDYLKNSTEGMGEALQAGLSLANSVFQEISSGKVAAIEREIEAEQRRDGKSAESLAKIKKLQAQQIKEEAKAKKASVGMSTAAAIMQIWAGPMGAFPPAAAAMTAVMAGLGAMQLSNIDKAANGQLAALNGSSAGNTNISAGSRENNIDVSRNANAGELAYLSGAAGSGTANNFTPGRSGFGTSSAGASIVVGESGPEIITPTVPVTVGPQSKGSGAQITFSPVYQLSAIDTNGMEELMLKHSKSVYESLEKELNAKNQTLGNLR